MPRALVLLSGGLDSATCAALARDAGHDIFTLTFDYGSRHSKEVDAANALAQHFGSEKHMVFKLALDKIGGSALLDESEEIRQNGVADDIPSTYVPARNIIFLSIALAHAERFGCDAIFIGANAIDYSGYPDCRPEFIEAFQKMADVGTKRGAEGRPIQIVAPLVDLSKAEIINKGMVLGVPYNLTWSCYLGGEKKACGKCDACQFRLKGFEEAGYDDPIEYGN